MNTDRGEVFIGEGTVVGDNCVLGCPKEVRLRDSAPRHDGPLKLGGEHRGQPGPRE